MDRRSFLYHGLAATAGVMFGVHSTRAGELFASGSPVYVGGWEVSQAKIDQGIERSEKVKRAQMMADALTAALHVPWSFDDIDIAKILKWKASGHRYAHTYLRIDGYDFHGAPADPQTGRIKNFMDFENSVLRGVVMKPEETERAWMALGGVRLPLRPLLINSRQKPPETTAGSLDAASGFNLKDYPYEAANWHQPLPWIFRNPPINSNTFAQTLLKFLNARGMNGETTLQELFPGYEIPGAEHDLLGELNIGSRFRDEARKGQEKIDALVQVFQQIWNAPLSSGRPTIARNAAPSPVVG